jgi:hypothetical protein
MTHLYGLELAYTLEDNDTLVLDYDHIKYNRVKLEMIKSILLKNKDAKQQRHPLLHVDHFPAPLYCHKCGDYHSFTVEQILSSGCRQSAEQSSAVPASPLHAHSIPGPNTQLLLLGAWRMGRTKL